jgi:hypothetical protein
LQIANCKFSIDGSSLPPPASGFLPNLQFAICNLQFAIVPIAAVLPRPIRLKMLFALLGIVLAGIGLIMMVVLAGRAVRRLARQRTGPSKPLDEAWYKRPLEADLPHDANEAQSDDA